MITFNSFAKGSRNVTARRSSGVIATMLNTMFGLFLFEVFKMPDSLWNFVGVLKGDAQA